MTKREELKTLSDETFIDNDQGMIAPSGNRVVNDAIIDAICDADNAPPALKIKLLRGVGYTDINKEGIIVVQHPALSDNMMDLKPKIVLMRKTVRRGYHGKTYYSVNDGRIRKKFKKRVISWHEVGDLVENKNDYAAYISKEGGIGTYNARSIADGYVLYFTKDDSLATQERIIKRFVKEKNNKIWIVGNGRKAVKELPINSNSNKTFVLVSSLFGFALRVGGFENFPVSYSPITPVRFVLLVRGENKQMSMSI